MNIHSRLKNCYSGALFDALREHGITNSTLPAGIAPVDRSMVTAGPAFTVSGRLEPGISEHESLLRWTEFLSSAPAGSVVVCQPNDSTLAHMGELSSETLKFRGVEGYIVDGGTRDSKFVIDIGFPVFARYQTPCDIVGRWVPTELGGQIRIGEVDVHSGDLVYGDIDGVVVVPAEHADSVIARVEEVMATENLVRKAILEGVDPKAAYLEHGLF